MATNFFQQQDQARRNTTLLIVYFALALLSLNVLTYALVEAVFVYAKHEYGPRERSASDNPRHFNPQTLRFEERGWRKHWHPHVFLATTGGVLLVVGLGSLFKIIELAAGGRSVALMLGGSELLGNSCVAHERRLLNVVEEMALASGVPVPPVFILRNEPGINAFAAGHSIGNAVVAVSQGCLDNLTRDELQGVVAHEFSHILNGDMRLNVRLIGLIFGIIGLSQIGYVLMRTSSGRKNGGQLVIVGAGLWALGSAGALFGWLIQAAVSRQREFLADASAVQFTRNPDGIGGALKKIGGLQAGSTVGNENAGQVSHMFFASAFRSGAANLFATHPPLAERISRIDPSFDGHFDPVAPLDDADESAQPASAPKARRRMPAFPALEQLPLPVLALTPDAASAHVGNVNDRELASAHQLDAAIPQALKDAAHDPMAARAIVYALLLDSDSAVRAAQLELLRPDANDFDLVTMFAPGVDALPIALRLPLADISLPALRQLSPSQHRAFRKRLRSLIDADGRCSLFEYVLHCVVGKYLDAEFAPRRGGVRHYSRSAVAPQVQVLLSLLAWKGQSDRAHVEAAYDAGARRYAGSAAPAPLLPAERCGLGELDAALQTLATALPAIKRAAIEGCAACILFDNVVTVREFELLRAVTAALDCPMPPLPSPVEA